MGHHVSNKGREPIELYTGKLKNLPRPESVSELQRFLGNYYRDYISQLAERAGPLNLLTHNEAAWEWGCQEGAFSSLRKALITEPVCLVFPNWGKELYVGAERSSQGIAAVLSQLDKRTNKLFNFLNFYFINFLFFFFPQLDPKELRSYAIRSMGTGIGSEEVVSSSFSLRSPSFTVAASSEGPQTYIFQVDFRIIGTTICDQISTGTGQYYSDLP